MDQHITNPLANRLAHPYKTLPESQRNDYAKAVIKAATAAKKSLLSSAANQPPAVQHQLAFLVRAQENSEISAADHLLMWRDSKENDNGAILFKRHAALDQAAAQYLREAQTQLLKDAATPDAIAKLESLIDRWVNTKIEHQKAMWSKDFNLRQVDETERILDEIDAEREALLRNYKK